LQNLHVFHFPTQKFQTMIYVHHLFFKVVCITYKLVNWRCMITFKFVYDSVKINLKNFNMIQLRWTFLNMKGDLYWNYHFKYTHINTSLYGKCDNICWVWLIFFETLITLSFILYWPQPWSLYIWPKDSHGEIWHFFLNLLIWYILCTFISWYYLKLDIWSFFLFWCSINNLNVFWKFIIYHFKNFKCVDFVY
jgi:hypothetical protein